MKILITGSSGLIGGEAVEYFDKQGHTVIGVDNNMRKVFFGEAGNTEWNLHRIFHKTKNYYPNDTDIRNYSLLENNIFTVYAPFDAIIHCAAQPSHDKAKDIPILDFEVNALGTLNLLELTRQYCPSAVFVFLSTNKVYGDAPNEIPLLEREKRYDYSDPNYIDGIDEEFRIDQSTHSIFGASKVAADIMVQEYGRYFGMNTCVFRGGCLTGPSHSGVELHGFLSYLVKCAIKGDPYTVFGYGGKQVRDNIHSYDVIRAIEEVIKNPRPGSVYNIGGGRENSVSMLEAIDKIEKISGNRLNWKYEPKNRVGDHMCYISNLSKFKRDYPGWSITKSIDRIFFELIGSNTSGTTERYIPGDGGDAYFNSYAFDIAKLAKRDVIDIGCGVGFLTEMIAKNPNVRSVLATDLYKGYQIENRKIKYQIIDTKNLIENNHNQYDTICSTEHIEHLEKPLQFKLLDWITKSLKSNGIFIGSMPFPDDPKNPNPFHLSTMEKDEWKAILESKFSKVDIWNCGEQRVYSWIASL